MNENGKKLRQFTIMIREEQYQFLLQEAKLNDIKLSALTRKAIDLLKGEILCQRNAQ